MADQITKVRVGHFVDVHSISAYLLLQAVWVTATMAVALLRRHVSRKHLICRQVRPNNARAHFIHSVPRI